MIELTADCFQEVCAEAPVREQLGSLETNRKKAVRKFWTYLIGGLVLAVLAFTTLSGAGWPTASWMVAALILLGGVMLGIAALSAVGASLKHPVLETIAKRAGMEYMPSDFSPPVYPNARKALFGGWLSTERFSDLFHGADEDGRGYAVYEACLQRRSGKNTQTVFTGQMYALQRRPGAAQGTTVIVPDRGIFNFFKPSGGMERVKFEEDAEFEKRFEVYSTAPLEAKQLLVDPSFRRRLMDLRQGGRTFAYFGPEDALIAVNGKDRFEAGSMLKSRGGEERVKSMLDDVCSALAILREFKAKLG